MDSSGIGIILRDISKDSDLIVKTPIRAFYKKGHYGDFLGDSVDNLKDGIQKMSQLIKQKPDFIVAYDNIRDIDIIESKRLNIPIVIIRKNILDKNERIDMEFDREKDRYVNSSSDEVVSRKFR